MVRKMAESSDSSQISTKTTIVFLLLLSLLTLAQSTMLWPKDYTHRQISLQNDHHQPGPLRHTHHTHLKPEEDEEGSEFPERISRRLTTLVNPQPLIIPYQGGPILSGRNGVTNLYVIFYGGFTQHQRGIVHRFLRSLSPPKRRPRASIHTVAKWWQITHAYKDMFDQSVAQIVVPNGEIQIRNYTLGRSLGQSDIEALVMQSLGSFETSSRALYIVLTSADVEVAGFCQESCGQHGYLYPSDATGGQMLPYLWVGDASSQCPGLCCWPFANLEYTSTGPANQSLVPPNGDLGGDGMIINLATLIAEAATDPYQNAYYQGDAGSPVEAAEACKGIFGPGAYSGYPGDVMLNNVTGGSFNVFGFQRDQFLLPWIWNPISEACAGQA